MNKPRVGDSNLQKVAANGRGFTVKKTLQQANYVGPKQKPRTMDSLFANMKEQRLRAFSQQIDGSRRNGGGGQEIVFVTDSTFSL